MTRALFPGKLARPGIHPPLRLPLSKRGRYSGGSGCLRGYDGEALGDLLLTLVSRHSRFWQQLTLTSLRAETSHLAATNSQREKDKADAYANRSTDSLDPRSRLCNRRPVWRHARRTAHL